MVAQSSIFFETTSCFASIFSKSFVDPIVGAMSGMASLLCVLLLINSGYLYITSSGKPEVLAHAKKLIRNALLGLIIILAASTLTLVLNNAYGSQSAHSSDRMPVLSNIQPQPAGSGIVDVLIKAITGLLQNIVQSIAAPFMKSLNYFTSSTPLMAANSSVFHLWLIMVSISDSLFVLIICLLGFHIMSYAAFGLDEIEFKHLLPRIGLVFLLLNASIFVIDGVIELSNAMISALNELSPTTSVWNTLSEVTKQSGSLGVASLLIMIVFLILSVILLIFYVGRLVTLYTGALLAPLICILWLIPLFKDFAEAAVKVYLATVFVLFVHVVILQLAASIFAGLIASQPNHSPDPVMAMIVGLATVVSLLKTQGLLMQLSYVGHSSRSVGKLGAQFVNVMSYVSNRDRSYINPYPRYDSPHGSNTSSFRYASSKLSGNDTEDKGYGNVAKKHTGTGFDTGNARDITPVVLKKQLSGSELHSGIEIKTKPVPSMKTTKRK